jgi:hypothetical protein
MAPEGWMVGRRQVVVSALLMPISVASGAIQRAMGAGQDVALLAAHAVGFGQPALVFLKPGTRVGEKPPEEWTHMVLKSVPRLATGDRGTLPKGSAETATMFRTALLADVKPVDTQETEFELVRIGLGVCVPVPHEEDNDMVVTAGALEALGLRFSMVERAVLDAAEAEMAEGRIIARTPTFALFRSPVMLIMDGEHKKARIYYAFCVDRNTGRLRVAAWTMRPDQKPAQAPATLVKLESDGAFDCQIDVRAKRILGTVPYSWSFAMRTLPPGRALRVPAAVGQHIVSVTSVRKPAGEMVDELERLLMETLAAVPDAVTDKAVRKTVAPAADHTIRQTASPPPYRKSQ